MSRTVIAMPLRIVTRAIAFALVAMLIIPIPATQASFPGINGPIVFFNCDSGDGSIWKINPDGSGLTQLTSGLPRFQDPHVSPDGSRVAFGNDMDDPDPQDGAIYVRSIDGGNPTLVSGTDGSGNNAITNGDPAWTPDGKKLVFACGDPNQHICTLPVTGGTPRFISGSLDGDVPDVRPDGKEVAFAKGGTLDIWSIPLGGGAAIRRTNCALSVSESCDFPSYSPDSSSIALQRGGFDQPVPTPSCIAVMPADGVNLVPSCLPNSDPVNGHPGEDENPSFSPDGMKIVADAGNGNLVILNADGSGSRTIIDVNALDPAVLHTCAPSWAASPLSFDRQAPESQCAKIFFDAQGKAEGNKAQLSVKFISAGCDAAALTALASNLTTFDAFIDRLVQKANDDIDALGGIAACDPNLQAQLPVTRADLLDGEGSGADFLGSQVQATCDDMVTP